MEKKWIWLKCKKRIRKKINLETYLLFFRERTLLLLHIELGKFQDFISFLFPRRLRWMFLSSLFLMETYSLHLCWVCYCFMGFVVVVFYYGCFESFLEEDLGWTLMALFMLFYRVGSLYPAKWRSYLGKHSIDWHIFLRSVVCCDEARTVRPRQKSHWECISTAMRTASFSITGDAKGKYSSVAREHYKLLLSSFMTLRSTRQSWLTGRKTALENSPLVNRVIYI